MAPVSIEVTKASQKRFLKAYKKLGVITHAAIASGVHRDTVKEWRRRIPEFQNKFNEARIEFAETQERKMLDLIDEQHANLDYKANPALMIFQMKAAMPEKYGDKPQVDTTANDFITEMKTYMHNAMNAPKLHESSIDIIDNQPSAESEGRKILDSRRGGSDDSSSRSI